MGTPHWYQGCFPRGSPLGISHPTVPIGLDWIGRPFPLDFSKLEMRQNEEVTATVLYLGFSIKEVTDHDSG